LAKRRRIVPDDDEDTGPEGKRHRKEVRGDAKKGPRGRKRAGPRIEPKTLIGLIVILVIIVLAAYYLTMEEGEDESLYDSLEFSGSNANGSVQWQCEQGYRIPNSSEKETVARYIRDTMRSYGYHAKYQNFTGWYGAWDGTLFSNVVATKESPDSSDPVILLIAHYDTRPYSDRNTQQPPGKRPTTHEDYYKPILGANDGASGVAVLLELARVMADEDLPYTLQFLFTDGEDCGPSTDDMYYGSRYFAENLDSEEVRDIAHVIVVDMVGDAHLRIDRERYSEESDPGMMLLIWKNAGKLGLDQFVDETGLYIGDDHNPFIDRGIPSIDLIDFKYPDKEVNYWHTQEDTPDKVSAESLEAVGRVLEYTLKQIDP
jgi:hypothetical protein